MENINYIYIYVPELFFFFSIVLILIFYLFSFYQVTVSNSSSAKSALFYTVLKFSSYVLFFTSILFVFQFVLLQTINQPVFLFNSMIYIDLFSVFFKFCVTLLGGLILNASFIHFVRVKFFSTEYLIIYLIFILSIIIGFSAFDFLIFYVSLELQSLSVYIMLIQSNVGFKSVKAGIKYFFYSLVSSVFFLFGVGFVYFLFGSINYCDVNLICETSSVEFKKSPGFIIAQVFVFSSVLFKLGVFPFQDWVPTTYSRNSLPTVFALATISKLFAFFVLVRFLIVFGCFESPMTFVLYWIGIVSIVWGVFGAFFQSEILKIIGYSAIAHSGYTLLVLSFFDEMAVIISVFYFTIYVFLSFSFFFILVTTLKINKKIKFRYIKSKPFTYVYELRGLAKSNWVLAFFISTVFFSYAGLPPFIGFYSKYLIFYYLIQQGFYFTFFFLFFCSVISTYYYLSIIISIYFKESVIPNLKVTHSNILMLVLFIITNSFSIFFIDYLFEFISALLKFLWLIN